MVLCVVQVVQKTNGNLILKNIKLLLFTKDDFMKHKGPYYGFNGGHIEYHTVNQKKKKAADCIYMTTSRMCQNNKSPEYLSKCFVSSACKYRVKEQDKEREIIKRKLEMPKKEKIVAINCSINKGCPIYSPSYGKGRFVGYDATRMIISVEFDGKIRAFQYPQAIFDKYLIVPKNIFVKVLQDKNNAKIELV